MPHLRHPGLISPMAYSPITPNVLPYFSKSFVVYKDFVDFLMSSMSSAFQTQSGRDSVRESLGGFLQAPVGFNQRFPAGPVFYIYLSHAAIAPLYGSLLASLDTRNRVIEVAEPSNPTTAEAINATKRTDDASVAARTSVEQLLVAIRSGAGVFNRDLFESESHLVWSETSASSK